MNVCLLQNSSVRQGVEWPRLLRVGNTGHRRLEPGTLWNAAADRSVRALKTGALQPVATESECLEDGGIPFVVRARTKLPQEHERGGLRRDGSNPFLPYDEDLFVAEISPTHVCLLNKFNVLSHHLLLVTRVAEPQGCELTDADFAALATCMAEFDSCGFYNGGAIAGASQSHKHLQLVPVPLAAGSGRTPMDSRLLADPEAPRLPFRHAFARLDLIEGPGDLLAVYRGLARSLGLDAAPRPYNLVVTRDWMLLVPRARECFEGVSINALGFAGSLLVQSREQLARVRELGPLRFLAEVSEPA